MTIDDLEALAGKVYAAADPNGVEELRAAASAVAVDKSAARQLAVRGGARLVAFKLGHDRGDLDEAISDLERAYAIEPTSGRSLNLASALLEQCDLDGSAADHRRAVVLLADGLRDPALPPRRRCRMAVVLLGALVDAVERGYPGANMNEAIELGERLVADPDRDAAGVGEAETLLGSAYLLAAQRNHPRRDYRRMVELTEIAAHALPEGHPDYPIRLSNWGSALLERYQILDESEDLDRAISALDEAYRTMPESHPGRRLLLNNIINAVVPQYERSGATARIGQYLPHALSLPDAFPPDHHMKAVAHANAGLFARAASRALDRPDLVDVAIEFHEKACDATSPDGDALAGRRASLALALFDRYDRDGDATDLHRAIELGEASMRSGTSHEVELVGFRANLANMYHDRYLLDRRMLDLVRAVELHERGIAELPRGHRTRVGLLNNAGIARAELYERLREPQDLDAAEKYFSAAAAAGSPNDPDLAGRLINLGMALRRRAVLTDDLEGIGAAIEATERARATARRRSDRDLATGQLIDFLRDLWHRTKEPALLDRIAELDRQAGPASTPTRRFRRAVTAGLLGDHAAEERHMIEALETGLEQKLEVTIAAAQLLADHGIRLAAAQNARGIELVEQAATAALAARDRLVDIGEARRVELSWHREFTGLGVMWAHARLLRGDLEGAFEAFEQTRAVMLRRHFPPSPRSALDEKFVALWATPVGGAALIREPDGRLEPKMLPRFTMKTAERLARRIATAAMLGRSSLEPVLAGTLRTLGSVVGPIDDALGAGEPIVCCPGGAAALLPLHAARTAGVPWIAARPIRVAVCYAAAAWSRRAGSTGSPDLGDVASIAAPEPSGLPRLPAAVAESAAFAGPQQRFHGAAASPHALLTALRMNSVVHVATHVVSAAIDPLAQHFVLADDQPLFADTILDAAPLAARLVVLAACGTGRTTMLHVDEGITLASVIHAAGVPTVLASLWSVYDTPTRDLMSDVALRLREGNPPASALRLSQIAAIDRGRPDADWAGFVTLGG